MVGILMIGLILKKHPGVAIDSCNDGLRPVIIKIERIED